MNTKLMNATAEVNTKKVHAEAKAHMHTGAPVHTFTFYWFAHKRQRCCVVTE